MEFAVRNMRRDELVLAVTWAKNEGWNPGLYDAECFWAVDPNGFFIGLLDGKPIGAISLVKYGDDYAFGGFYIVNKEFRGSGYGMQLTQTALKYASDRNIGGDSVVENVGMYAKLGMKLAHYNARYNFVSRKIENIEGRYLDAFVHGFEKLAEYDSSVFGYDRREFLQLWVTRPETRSFAHIDLPGTGKIQGYGVIRKCYSGYKIGPLFADDATIAANLFYALVDSVPEGQEISWDVSEECSLVPKMVDEFSMKKVFGTGRMYLKGQPKFPLEKWFGITSFELG